MTEKVGEEAFQILVIDKVLLRAIAPGTTGIGEATVEVARGFGARSVDLPRSKRARFSGSDRSALAAEMSLKRASASAFPGFRSGWYFFASLR